MSYSYDRSKFARANATILTKLNDMVNDFDAVYHDTVRSIIHINDPKEREETYEVLKQMLELEVDDNQKRIRDLAKK